MQRVVHPRCGEQRERAGLARGRLEGAVGDAVVHRVQVGQIEAVAQQQAALGAQVAFDVVVLGERKVHRDRLRAGADLERHLVVLQQQSELFEVVARKQVGPRQRGLVGAGARHETIAQARVGARHRVGVHAHERVAGPHPAGERVAGHERLQRVAQVRDAAVVDRTHLGQRGIGIVEACRRNVVRGNGHGAPRRGAAILTPRWWPARGRVAPMRARTLRAGPKAHGVHR